MSRVESHGSSIRLRFEHGSRVFYEAGEIYRKEPRRSTSIAAPNAQKKLKADFDDLQAKHRSSLADARRFAALAQASKRSVDPDEICRYIRDVMLEDFGFDRAGVFSYDSATETMQGVCGTDPKGEFEDISDQQFGICNSDLKLWAVLQGEGRGFHLRRRVDDDATPGLAGPMSQVNDHAEIFLASAGEVVGYMAVDNLLTNRPITEAQMNEVMPFAEHAAQALLNARFRAYREAVIAQQRRLTEMALAVTSNEDQQDVFLMVRNAVLELGSVDRAAVFVVDGKMARGTWGTNLNGELQSEWDFAFPIDPASPYFVSFEDAENPFVIDTISIDGAGGERWVDIPHAFIPLRSGGVCIGLIAVDNLLTGRKITSALLREMLPIADHAAVAIQKARILSDREKLVLLQKRFLDIAVAIVASQDEDSIFRMVRDAVLETNAFDRAGVWLIEENIAKGTWGTDSAGALTDEHGMSFSLDSPRNDFSPCLDSDAPYVIDHYNAEISSNGESVSHTPHGLIPIRAGSELIGMITVDMLLTMRPITPEMMELVVPVANLAAVVVVKRRLRMAAYAEVERRSEIEALLVDQTHELIAARDEALAGTRAKSQFLANMSHELRTPVNGVIGLNSLLMQTSLSSQQIQYATGVQKCAELLISLINSILDASKLSAGELSLVRLPFNLRDCINDIAAKMAARITREDVKLTSSVADDFPDSLLGDETRVRQIITSLVDNAIKFTHKGEVRLLADSVSESSKDVNVRIEVMDTGIGIPEDLQSEVFESFRQADGTSTRHHDGSGLGLSIVKQLVELMDGRVHLHSRLGEGTTVTVEITLAKLPAKAAPGAPDTSREVELKLRVLVAEDNPVNAMVALGRLEQWGCECLVVENGKEAVETIQKHHLDVVLMDISMPEMDGIQATQEVRRIEQTTGGHLPIIAVTAHAMDGDREKCLAAGMDDYVVKPVDFSLLLEKLRFWGHHR